MNNIIDEYKNWLTTYYRETLNLAEDLQPSFLWRSLDRATLKPSTLQSSTALVEDASIGLALLVVEISGGNEQEIKESITADLHRALSFRSKLLPVDTGNQIAEDDHDPDGTWRVAILWLCPSDWKQAWKSALMDTRRQSSVFDELTVDAVFVEEKPLAPQFSEHGSPCLLLHTRRLFSRKSEEVDRWANADEKVKQEFEGFSTQFNDTQRRDIASGITEIVSTYHPTQKSSSDKEISTIDHIEIENLRCINHLKIDDANENDKSRAWIIHGPNGTGKSTITEAIALKSFGTSFRYEKYLRDEDVTKNKNANGYLSGYLQPIHNIPNAQQPIVRLTKNDLGQLDNLATSPESSKAALSTMEGTLISQEDAGEFVKFTGTAMAARLATSFSELARKIEEFTANGYDAANARRIEFNRRFGMTASTKLKETIRGKIAASILARLPSPETNFIEWLKLSNVLYTAYSSEAKTLQLRLEEAQKKTLAENIGKSFAQLAALGVSTESLTTIIKGYYEERLSLLDTSSELLKRFLTWRQGLGEEIYEVVKHCRVWAQWLARSRAQEDATLQQRDVIAALEKELLQTTETRKRAEAAGKVARLRFDHLNIAQSFIREHWASEHPENCPTCNSYFSDGIVSIVEAIHAEADAALNDHRKTYELLTQRIKEIQEQIKSLSSNSCPVPEATRLHIGQIFSGLIGTEQNIEQWLSFPGNEVNILRYFGYIESPPSIQDSAKYDVPADSQRMADDLTTEWNNANLIAEEPDAWENVKKEVSYRLQSVVEKHLPETVERVWFEIALALTPARWLLPGPAAFKVDERRGSRRVDVMVEGRLARYIFNNAEQNVLGLAWAFVRHLTEGRFHHAWLLLDDPAQEMDQPTFRELCRFLASLLRLYKTSSQPFKLITLLHQEERALDLARETDSGLYLLGWTTEQGGRSERSDVRRIRLTGPGTHSPKPEALFSQIATSMNLG